MYVYTHIYVHIWYIYAYNCVYVCIHTYCICLQENAMSQEAIRNLQHQVSVLDEAKRSTAYAVNSSKYSSKYRTTLYKFYRNPPVRIRGNTVANVGYIAANTGVELTTKSGA